MIRPLAVVFALLASLAAPLAASATAIAKTDAGWLTGATRGASEVFLGVPYAAPPVGPLRWAPPAPVAEWGKLRPATASAEPCSAPPSGDGPRYVNEDCLYLDVYRPAGAKPGDRLPVMVFVHGGAHLWGSPGIYDGARMAEVGKAIVVIPAYRLGVFGALAAPEAGRAGGAFGLQDLTAALEWVKRNAAAFGGDGGDVTLFGQSAGASNVCALLAAPTSRGLFRQAILQSGGCARPTLEAAQAGARAFAGKVGCPNADLACLRGKDAGALLDAWTVSGPGPAGTDFLPTDPAVAMASGRIHQMPILIGFTRDERWPYEHGLHPLSDDGFRAQLRQRYGDQAPDVAARYAPADFPHREYALGAAAGDQRTVCPALALADKVAAFTPVALYEFADRTTPPFRSLGPPQPRPPGYSPGAFHTAELQFLLGYKAAEGPLDAAQRARGDEMIRRWVAFGRAEAWSTSPAAVQRFDDAGIRMLARANVEADHRCGLWAK